MTTKGTTGLTRVEFRHLPDDAQAELNRAGASTTYGWTVGGRRSPGATWINVTSDRGHGRLIRYGDGSFDSTSFDGEGEQLHDAHGTGVGAVEFRALIVSLSTATTEENSAP